MDGFVVEEVAGSVRWIVPAFAGVVVHVGFENVLGPMWIVLEPRQAFGQTGAAFVDEEAGPQPIIGIAQEAMDGGPAVDALDVRRAQLQAVLAVFVRDGEAVILSAEAIGARHDPTKVFRRKQVALQKLANGKAMLLRRPAALDVFIDNDEVAVAIFAAEEENGVMGEAVIESTEPFVRAAFIERIHYVNVAAEGAEELAGGDVPIAMEPGAFLPAGKFCEHFAIARIDETVVRDFGLDEAGFGFLFALPWFDEHTAVPSMADPARIGGRVKARTPVGFRSAQARADALLLAP